LPNIDFNELEPAIRPAFCDTAGVFGSGLDAAERVAGSLLLLVSSPVIAAATAALALMSRRSPFVAHLRVGKNGKPLWVLKLRTMWEETALERPDGGWLDRYLVEHIVAEADGDPKDPADARVANWFAAFCRRHSIDEFPQLWHVVRGEMSLVGPRPLTRTEVRRHYGGHADELLAVRPGLTGLWQTAGRSHIRFPERAAMDLELVRNMAPSLYAKILLRTLPALVQGKGAW
jgi:exopolysaccharide production protein ExoY